MRIFSPTFEDLPQAFITNTSLTAMHARVSTPFARSWSASCTKPGRCFASQVGVKAPGTENSTTFLPLNSSSVATSFGPSLVIVFSVPEGMRSPALMLMVSILPRASSRLLRVQRPQIRDPFQCRVTLDGLEGLHVVILLAILQLRDAQQQMRLGLVLQAALGEALGEEVHGLVVLLIAQIRQPDADIL